MQPTISFDCESSSSWVCIGVFRPRRLTTTGLSSAELVERIASISRSFNRFAKTAVLNSKTSNHVAIISSWERNVLDVVEPCTEQKRSLHRLLDSVHDSISKRSGRKGPLVATESILDAFEKALSGSCHVIHVSWYEASCWDFKELRTQPASSKPNLATASPSPPPLGGRVLRSHSSPLPTPASTPKSNAVGKDDAHLPLPSLVEFPSDMHRHDDQSSSNLLAKTSSSPYSSHPAALAPMFCLFLGDIVHLRCITSHEEHLHDTLSYSCLAILKAYFAQTEGLLSYVFYRSLDGSRMAGLGVWHGVDDAMAHLCVPEGAYEERYWRSMGAKTRYDIYEVAALVA